MARDSHSSGSVVRCDFPKCPRRFVTYSIAAEARGQAEAEGWARTSGKGIKDTEGYVLSTKKVDLCPDHKPKPHVMGA